MCAEDAVGLVVLVVVVLAVVVVAVVVECGALVEEQQELVVAEVVVELESGLPLAPVEVLQQKTEWSQEQEWVT